MESLVICQSYVRECLTILRELIGEMMGEMEGEMEGETKGEMVDDGM